MILNIYFSEEKKLCAHLIKILLRWHFIENYIVAVWKGGARLSQQRVKCVHSFEKCLSGQIEKKKKLSTAR